MKKILDNDKLWQQAFAVGIDKRMLERKGYMDILLAGDETPEMDLRLNYDGIIIWMTGTLRLVENEHGEMDISIKAQIPQEDSDEQGE
jgi:hypothetical protein